MLRTSPWLLALLALVALACRPFTDAGPGAESASGLRSKPAATRLSLIEALSPPDVSGFSRALEPRAFSFPRDHGPHPSFQTEWWYVVGNLGGGGQRFGYQLTFFRSALGVASAPNSEPTSGPESAVRPSAGATPSPWRGNQVYMAHFAVTEPSSRVFHSFERFSRAAVDLAGARAQPFAVWLEDWRLETAATDPERGVFPLRLRASDGVIALELELEPGKPPVLQGNEGLSAKGSTPGNASYYYSITRMPTSGRLAIGDRVWEVEGSSWLDREWGTSLLEPGVEGWDWFALQLSDGREVMFYRLRRDDGRTDSYSRGVIVDVDGGSRALDANDVELVPLRSWTSGATGAVYPSGWRLISIAADLDLTLEPILEAQEHDSTVLYWEGAVDAVGESGGQAVTGRGFVELTGYSGSDDVPGGT